MRQAETHGLMEQFAGGKTWWYICWRRFRTLSAAEHELFVIKRASIRRSTLPFDTTF